LTTKGNKIKTGSNTAETKATKRSNAAKKKQQTKPLDPIIFTSTGLSSKPIDIISTPPTPTNITAKKSVTNAVISYLHYRGAHGGHVTGRQRKRGHIIMHVLHESIILKYKFRHLFFFFILDATNNSEATVTVGFVFLKRIFVTIRIFESVFMWQRTGNSGDFDLDWHIACEYSLN
jgi:hypothetical protein